MRTIPCILVCVFSLATVSSAQSVFYFPQIVDGSPAGTTWFTVVAISNPAATGTALATGTITFTQDNGAPWSIALADELQRPLPVGSTVSFQVAGGQTRFFVTPAAGSPTSGPLIQGFAAVSSNLPVVGGAVFFEFAGSGNQSSRVAEAGVASATPLKRQAMPAILGESTNTAVAVANPGTSKAGLTFELLDTNGVSPGPTAIRELPPNNHTAFFVSELFPNVRRPFSGMMRITSFYPSLSSDAGVVITALLFEEDGKFATLPVFPVQ